MATPLPPGLVWRKSSASSDNGMCVEVATLPRRRVAVRDSKHPAGHLVVTHRALLHATTMAR